MWEEAHNYCLLGPTNDELAELFAVSPRTIDSWTARHRDSESAVKSSRIVADARLRNRRRRTWRDPARVAPDDPPTQVDDIVLLDAAGESRRHRDGD